MVFETDDSQIEALLQQPGKTLVDFYSPYCGPCKMLAYVLDSVAKDVVDVKILKLDFEKNKEAVARYAVTGYPTLILFSDGVEQTRRSGLQSRSELIKMLG